MYISNKQPIPTLICIYRPLPPKKAIAVDLLFANTNTYTPFLTFYRLYRHIFLITEKKNYPRISLIAR